jgi:RNA polymerase sigma-70 factor (ECF subfamily)
MTGNFSVLPLELFSGFLSAPRRRAPSLQRRSRSVTLASPFGAPANKMPSTAMPSIDLRNLEEHRRAMFKYAMLQLRNETHAEDCVQEALAAAVQSANGFAGNSSVRTWLIGILKHKIIDHFRRASREQPLSVGEEETSLDDFDPLFKPDGHFVEPPAAWANPEQALTQQEFFAVLESCMQALPKVTARVFAMREVMGASTEEICAELGITANNCWVLIYRARMSLRECIEKRWFAVPSPRASA